MLALLTSATCWAALAWGRCLFTGTASDVQRLPWKVPSGLKDASTYLNNWKFKPVPHPLKVAGVVIKVAADDDMT
jgi:hypothetical protein